MDLKSFAILLLQHWMYAPCNVKHARGYQKPFMTRHLSKKVMKRSRLRNRYLKVIMKKIGNCIPNKETIASFAKKS